MRIHTNLTDMHDLARKSGAPITVNATEHGSRTHARAFEVSLDGTGGVKNFGGGNGEPAATWDEWGAFFGALYDADPAARCGGTAKRPGYADQEHYHFVTGHRFEGRTISYAPGSNEEKLGALAFTTHLPEDTHARHNWQLNGDLSWYCKKCSAERPSWQQTEAYQTNGA